MKEDANASVGTIEQYLLRFPAQVQEKLRTVRDIIAQASPGATEKISYGIPTFYLRGNLIHFAAFKHHIGLYPGAEGVEYFRERLLNAGYRISEGTIRFPLDQPLPESLIREIAEHCYERQKKI